MDCQTIKLWYAEINPTDDDYLHHWSLLDSNERQYVANLKNQLIQKRYVKIHGRLRILLAETLKVNPTRLSIHKAEYGKPYLADYPEFKFNLSHTSNQMVLAIGWDNELGVDIEGWKPRPNLAALVDKCFADIERNYWLKLPQSEQIEAFYRFWTRKEAFMKATGRGIALGLKQCVINPENPNKLLSIPPEFGLPDEWFIQDLDMTSGLSGSIVVQTKNPCNIELVKL